MRLLPAGGGLLLHSSWLYRTGRASGLTLLLSVRVERAAQVTYSQWPTADEAERASEARMCMPWNISNAMHLN